MDIAALIVAIAALGLSGWAAWSAYQSAKAARETADTDKARRADEVKDRAAAELAARRADLHASQVGVDAIIIRNTGQCRAREVTFLLRGHEPGFHPPEVVNRQPREIGPGESLSWTIFCDQTTGQTSVMTLNWVDDVGPHEVEQTITR